MFVISQSVVHDNRFEFETITTTFQSRPLLRDYRHMHPDPVFPMLHLLYISMIYIEICAKLQGESYFSFMKVLQNLIISAASWMLSRCSYDSEPKAQPQFIVKELFSCH